MRRSHHSEELLSHRRQRLHRLSPLIHVWMLREVTISHPGTGRTLTVRVTDVFGVFFPSRSRSPRSYETGKQPQGQPVGVVVCQRPIRLPSLSLK